MYETVFNLIIIYCCLFLFITLVFDTEMYAYAYVVEYVAMHSNESSHMYSCLYVFCIKG